MNYQLSELPLQRKRNVQRVLTRREKAAIVVRLMRAEGMDLSLEALPEDMQVSISESMTDMKYVTRVTLLAIVGEFVQELEGLGLHFPRELTSTLDVLDGSLSDKATAELRRSAGLGVISDPWERLAHMDNERLVPILEEESTEIASVMLSKLKVSKSAELLGLLPGARARAITYAMSQTTAVSPDMVHKIGEALVSQLESEAPKAFGGKVVERVGELLNYSASATRDDVLEGLEAEDKAFADEVRKSIFTFINIPERVDARDVPRVTREVDGATLVTALAAALPKEPEKSVAEFILENMSKRMADQLRDEIEAVGSVKDKDGEVAMTAVVSSIRELEASGELMLLSPDEE